MRAADLGIQRTGDVTERRIDARQIGQPLGQQRVLQRDDLTVLALVHPRPRDGHGALSGERLEVGLIILVEGARRLVHEVKAADRSGGGSQREHSPRLLRLERVLPLNRLGEDGAYCGTIREVAGVSRAHGRGEQRRPRCGTPLPTLILRCL